MDHLDRVEPSEPVQLVVTDPVEDVIVNNGQIQANAEVLVFARKEVVCVIMNELN